MDIRIIKTPSPGTLDIIKHRMGTSTNKELRGIDAVGLLQGKMIEMICAADIAEKTADVTVSDLRGNCPNNMIMVGIFGDTSSVESAIQEIKQTMREGTDS
ncbi:BMC domain-containing protein [Clostridium aminobutyricum]|uniref:BMC domain-containing protein n=1 Tax=Clostridium aminobutyricum TaxID=33953 RepID=A0A939DAL3_CLOAM|nr:BMC domain-containing protein [Clostridium aminobutyricum]MBN7774444.1 BMC domain-containing protein [Clostridium aminobutyricum]